MQKSKSARKVQQQTKSRPDVGDEVIHRGKMNSNQEIDAIYSDNGVSTTAGDFYRGDQISYAGNNQWRANCGEDGGCCQPQRGGNRN
jgi:hypothetical protein